MAPQRAIREPVRWRGVTCVNCDLLRVSRYDSRLELEEVGVVGIDRGAHPVRVPRTEGLDACKVRQHTAVRTIDRLVDLEVVAVAVNECHLAWKRDGRGAQGVDVIGERVP